MHNKRFEFIGKNLFFFLIKFNIFYIKCYNFFGGKVFVNVKKKAEF